MEEMIKRVNRLTAFFLIPLSLVSLFFTEWRFPVSILVAGGVGVSNLKGLAWSVHAFLGTQKAQAKMTVVSILRLLFVSSVLVALGFAKMINVWGLLIGFTAVFVITIREGWLLAKRES